MNASGKDATDCEKLHQLLYCALIEIRHEGRKLKHSSVFGLADLLHAIPLELERCAKGEADYDDVFSRLREKAKERNCEAWLENHLKSLGGLGGPEG